MKKVILLSTLFLLSSCASILTGSSRSVLFETDPSGATVFINGMEKGVTPTQINVEADDRVDFRLDNYRERVVVMDSKFNLVAIINGFSLIGWGIDALTGSLQRVDTSYVKVDLDPDGIAAANLQNYLDKGEITDVRVNQDDKLIVTTIVLE